MFLVPWILFLLAVPLHGYDVMMVIGGRYYDHARQSYIELSTVEVYSFENLLFSYILTYFRNSYHIYQSTEWKWPPSCHVIQVVFRLSDPIMFAPYLTFRSQGDGQLMLIVRPMKMFLQRHNFFLLRRHKIVSSKTQNISPKARSQCSTLGKLCSCLWWTQWPSCLRKVKISVKADF